jgi:hypothetical protein
VLSYGVAKSTRFSLSSILDTALSGLAQRMCVATPAIVQSYNASAKTCTAKPAVSRLIPAEDEDDLDEPEEYPVVQDIPVIWPRGHNFAIHGTLAAGDTVMLVAMDWDMGNWRGTSKVSAPFDARQHDYASCVAIPGLLPATNPYPEPTDAAALASLVMTELGKLRTALEDLTTAYNLHTHPATSGTTSATLDQQASFPAAEAGVASDVLKVNS